MSRAERPKKAFESRGDKRARAFESLLEYLSRTRGFDFRVYKRASLMRRFEKRLQQVGVQEFEDYTDYLEVHPEEFSNLFNSMLINVTAFFRDAGSWAFLKDEIVPRILTSKGPDEPVRAWTAGCATGEETYSLAMVLAEAMGQEAFVSRAKIYASDIDDDALAHARASSFDQSRMAAVPEPLRAKYFESQRDRWVFNSDMRRAIIFGRHNVVSDAPISRLDLLLCRNTLMYFNAETQAQILARFHFALSEHGYLFLGRAEMLVTHTGLFAPVNLRHRVFARAGRTSLRDRLLALPTSDGNADELMSVPSRLREATLEQSDLATFVVDVGGVLMLANARARSLFSVGSQDIGRPMSDPTIPHSAMDLRPLIQSAYAEGHPVTISGVERRQPGHEVQYLRVSVHPVRDERGDPLGVVVTLEDQTAVQRLQLELERTQGQLEAAHDELQSTNGELETTNEELQSSNEELETTNEELQSANEELETMNEELQSTNEELQTINDELRQRTEEAGRATGFLESILAGLSSGVVVVNNKLNVMAWSNRAEDLWGLRAEEVKGQSLLGLDIGLPLDELRHPLRSMLGGDGRRFAAVLDARNRRGKQIKCRVTMSPLGARGNPPDGVIVLMEEWEPGGDGAKKPE